MTHSFGLTDYGLPSGKMRKWILAKLYQRKIFSYGDMSSDRLREMFLHGIALLRANIAGLCSAGGCETSTGLSAKAITLGRTNNI